MLYMLAHVIYSKMLHQLQSTEKVLILEYMDGIRLNDSESLEAFAIDKQKIIEEITRAYAHQIYIDGFFNGDPHPGILSFSPPPLFLFFIPFHWKLCFKQAKHLWGCMFSF